MGLDQEARNWPTATAKDADSAGNRSSPLCNPGTSLHEAATKWPTPNAADSQREGTHARGNPTLPKEASHWPTPRADSKSGSRTERGNPAKDGEILDQVAAKWSTPVASGEDRGPATYKQGGTPLKQQATHWPTPRTLTGGGESAERKKELGRDEAGGGDLQAAAETWPTPNQRDYKGSDLKTRRGGGELESLRREGEEDSLFPPGPRDFDAWGRVVEDGSADFRAPAIKPGLRLLVNGVALVVDESRRDQLRAGGNGVVPLEAAFALVVLARKAGLI